jgi:hypothetical protein
VISISSPDDTHAPEPDAPLFGGLPPADVINAFFETTDGKLVTLQASVDRLESTVGDVRSEVASVQDQVLSLHRFVARLSDGTSMANAVGQILGMVNDIKHDIEDPSFFGIHRIEAEGAPPEGPPGEDR